MTHRPYEPDQFQLICWLLVLCAVLLIALVAHGILAHDAALLSGVLALISDIVIAILAWVIGRYAPRKS